MKNTVKEYKGELAIDVDGKTQFLKLPINAICDVEDEMNMGIGEVLEMLDQDSFHLRAVRVLLWGGLNGGKFTCTIEKAGEIMEDLGLHNAGQAISQLVTVTFPTGGSDGAKPEGNGQAVSQTGKTS